MLHMTRSMQNWRKIMSNTNTSIEKNQNHNNTVNIPQRTEQPTYYTPLVDIGETGEGFTFHADLPGAKPGDVDISYENGSLTIEAKVEPRQPANHNYVWREYGVGHFYRTFSINTPIDVDGIKAELKNGELSVFVPKAEQAKSRKIKVKSE
jgi:HSP20 family molecular chaperone IbpA